MANLPEVPIWGPVHQLALTDLVIGGLPDRLTGAGKSNWPGQDLANRTAYLKQAVDLLSLKAGSTVTVGAGGDYQTINEALSDLSERRPAYTPGGFTTEIRLLSGFVMAEQVAVSAANLGWTTITSEDAEVFIDRAYLTDNFGTSEYGAFHVLNGGFLPAIGTQFVMMATGTAANRSGLVVGSGGVARVLSGGVRSAGNFGAFVSGGRLEANSANFSNALQHGISAGRSANVAFQFGIATGCGDRGISVRNAGVVHAGNANLSGCGIGGAYADQGASIYIGSSNCRAGVSDAAQDIQVGSGALIAAVGAIGGTNVTPNTNSSSGIIFK